MLYFINLSWPKEEIKLGGLHKTGLVEQYSISHYVPFLPLEKEHVVQCLQRDVYKQHQVMSKELEQQVLDELPFGPAPEFLFALSGCKQVAEKASSLIEREKRRGKRKKY